MIEWLQASPTAVAVFGFCSDQLGPTGWWFAVQLCFLLGGMRFGLRVALIGSVALVTNTALKWLIAAPRPYFIDPAAVTLRATPGFGMPSDHAQGSAAIFGAIGWYLRRRWLLGGMLVLVFMIGASRVVLGVHSPAQVAAGWLLGLGIVAVAVRFGGALGGWFDARTLATQALVVLGALSAAWAVCFGAWLSGAGFETPASWLASYRVATAQPDAGVLELGLYDPSGFNILAIVAGYLILLLVGRLQPVTVAGARQRIANVALSVVLNAVFLGALAGLVESPLALAAIALHPLVCIYQPMWLTHRLLRDRAVANAG